MRLPFPPRLLGQRAPGERMELKTFDAMTGQFSSLDVGSRELEVGAGLGY